MLKARESSEAVLKGSAFAARVGASCANGPPVETAAGLRYRRILAPGMVGGETFFALQGFINHGLRLRGAEVTCLLCDQLLPACTLRKVDHFESACLRWCHKNAAPFARAMQLRYHWYSEFLSPLDKARCTAIAAAVPTADISTWRWRGIELGSHVMRSLESYFKIGRADLADPRMAAKAREFLLSALLLVTVSRRALRRLMIDKVVVVDGFKTDWGIVRAVAVHQGIPVDVLLAGPRGHCVMVEFDRPPQPAARMPWWSEWRDHALTAAQESALDEYFRGRETRPYQGLRFCSWTRPGEPSEIRRQIGLPDKITGRIFGMFPNVSYDAGRTSIAPAFDTAAEWVEQTIAVFRTQPRDHLVIKVNPAERYRAVLDPLVDFIAQQCAPLPPNVHVIPPETTVTAHAVLKLIDVALVYTSTVAVEAAMLGKPVILAGGGWHHGRGITLDVHSPREYRQLLERIFSGWMPPPPPAQRARRYAYALFFRAALPITHYSALDTDVTRIHLQSLHGLLPGGNPTIDLLCRGILMDEPFHAADGSLYGKG